MAKLRSNHVDKKKSSSGGTIARVGILGAILAGLFYLFQSFMGGDGAAPADGPAVDDYAGADYYLPAPSGGTLVRHRSYALSYNEDWEQAEWVAYILTREELQRPWNERVDNFRPDPAVKSRTASLEDYRGSGYDRGHLLPVADRAFDAELADETFYMSNITPQARQFNQGIWRELEELTRDWAKRNGRLYVVTGPVLTQAAKGTIGANKIPVPAAYYKVLLDLDEPETKAIAFLLPNQVSFDPLYDYVVSVDDVETATGIDFFPDLMPPDVEERLEARSNIDLWPFSKKKFDRRINDWNNVN